MEVRYFLTKVVCQHTCALPSESKAKCVQYPPQRYYLERVPLGPTLLHYISLLFGVKFPDDVICFALPRLLFLALLQSIPCGHRITLHNGFRLNLPIV